MDRRNFVGTMGTAAAVTVLLSSLAAVGDMGEGIKAGAFTISPGVELKGIYNSNVQRVPDNEESDVSAILMPGVLIRQKSDTVRIDGSLWGRFERYSDLTEEDHDDFGENLGVSLWNRKSCLISVNESYQKIQELDYAVGKIEARKLLALGLSAGKDLTDKLQLDAGYGFNDTTYDSPRLFDWSESAANVELSHAVTEKSSAMLAGKAGTQSTDGSESDANFQSVLLGAKTRLTQKVQAKAGIGWYGHDSDVDDISIFGYDAKLAWLATPKLIVQAAVNDAVQPSILDRDNYRIVSTVQCSGTWSIDNSYSATIAAFFIQNDYDSKVMTVDGVETDKKDDTAAGSLRLTYTAPAKLLSVFIEGRYENRDSTIDSDDHSQAMISAGAGLVY